MAAVVSLYFVLFVLTLMALCFAGAALLRILRYQAEGFYSNFFYRSLAGLLASVFLFSVIASSLKTVLWGILIVALLMWYEFRISPKTDRRFSFTQPNEEKKSIRNLWTPLFLLAVIVFGWFAVFTFNWHSDFIYAMPHKDKVYYANISSALVEYGIENRQGAYYPSAIENMTEPYHYFDLWFTAMMVFFTGKPAVLIISLLCLPVCTLITIAGVLSIFESNGTIKPWHYIMVVLLLFIRGLYLRRHDPQIAWAENFTESVMEFKSEKLGILYIVGVFSFRLLLNGNLLPGLVSLLFLPVVSIGNLPGVVGGVVLFALILFMRKKVDLRSALRVLLYCVIVVGFIFGFYHFTGGSNVYLDKGPLVFTDMDTIKFRSVKIALVELFVRIMNNPWRAALMHLPFLLIAWLAARENAQYRRAFVLVGCIYFVSLITYGLFYKLADAPQFYTNDLPLLNVFLIVGSALVITSRSYSNSVRIISTVTLAGILCVMAVYSALAYRDSESFTELYSDKYLCDVDSLHKKIAEKSGVAVLYNPSQKPDLYNCDMSGPNVLYLSFFQNFRIPVDLNIFESRELTWGNEMGDVQKRFIRKAPFQQFVLRQVADGTFTDISTSQVEYLKKENIGYLIVSPGIIPDHKIISLVRKRIKDERSGEQFLVLNEIP